MVGCVNSNMFHSSTAYPCFWSTHSYGRYTKGGLAKSKPSEFAEWKKRNIGFFEGKKAFIIPFKKDPRWAKLERVISINVKDNEGNTVELQPKQRYIICIDPKSPYAGNMYNDDNPGIITLKLVLSVIARIIHIVCKIFYHLFIGWIVAIAQGVKAKESSKEIGERVWRHFADVIRTEIYETTMMLAAIAAPIVVPCKPTLAYDLRAFTGDLSHQLYWGKRFEIPVDMTPCMRREANIMDFEKNEQIVLKDRFYEDETNPTLVALDNKLQ